MKRDRFQKMTRGDNLGEVLEGLEEALKAGLLPVKINMVVIKGFNDDEIVDFALLSRTRPFHVRYIEYMPFNTQEGWQRDKCITAKEIKEIIEGAAGPLEPVAESGGVAGPARRFRFKDAPRRGPDEHTLCGGARETKGPHHKREHIQEMQQDHEPYRRVGLYSPSPQPSPQGEREFRRVQFYKLNP